jgi:hypothetical protein
MDKIPNFFKMKKFLPALFLMIFCASASAQLERTLFQSFEIDSVKAVNFEFKEDFLLETWAGNTVLIETKIKLHDATRPVLDYFIKHGRYEIKMDKTATDANFRLMLPDRKPIKTNRGECQEEVVMKVLVPDHFEWELEDKLHLVVKIVGN